MRWHLENPPFWCLATQYTYAQSRHTHSPPLKLLRKISALRLKAKSNPSTQPLVVHSLLFPFDPYTSSSLLAAESPPALRRSVAIAAAQCSSFSLPLSSLVLPRIDAAPLFAILSLSSSSQMAYNSLRQVSRSFRTNISKRFYSAPPSSTQQSGEQLQKKATEFAASAQETLNKAWGVTKKSLGPFGERLAGALGTYRTPVIYNLQVTRELLKQVYVAERLQIPHWTTFVSEYGLLWSRVRNPAFLRELVRSGEWMKVGVYAVEGYGIFKIGEIIGRRSLVGYNVQ